MPITIIQVDAFTDRPFRGNPAAVCLLDEPRNERWMQDVAAEMNLAETAFLQKREDGYDLRWFTPTVEVDLCGHATLASAHVLWEEGLIDPETPARFHTRSGLLTARRDADSIELDFPADPANPVDPPQHLIDGLEGVTPVYVGKSKMNYIVAVESEAVLRGLRPDFRLLGRLEDSGAIVTAPSDDAKFDFVSRYFVPACGIDEDPVTGSAHCCLGPYWRARLGRDQMVGFQASARGGVVHVRVNGDRIKLGGQAVTIFRAQLTC